MTAAKAFLGKGDTNQALQYVSAVLAEDEGVFVLFFVPFL